MFPVFISYSSKDVDQASRLYSALECAGIGAWFAPKDIDDGENFSDDIGIAIDECSVVVALLSRNYMSSKWCPKEIKLGINKGKNILALRIDHTENTPQFDLILADIQVTDAYHLENAHLNALCKRLHEYVSPENATVKQPISHTISCSEIETMQIASGDPYYEEGWTLHALLTNLEFYLAPPRDGLTQEQLDFLEEHSFATEDQILDTTLEKVAEECGIPDLIRRIDESRVRILQVFLDETNGCYFNNKKYGINRIRPFGRSEDGQECPNLTLELYTTDYYTHRVMKDVCKQYYSESPEFCQRCIDFAHIEPHRILFTSLGMNLLLLDTENGTVANALLTSRSKNSAETYGKTRYSLSVIEGVSLSDYDSFSRRVRFSTAAERGLLEELGIETSELRRDSMRFYDLFVNLANLEIGISCSVELRPEYDLEDILRQRGKDHLLEVAEKRVCPVMELKEFVYENKDEFLTQAVYAIGSYLNSLGMEAMDYTQNIVSLEEMVVHGKRRDSDLCGDAIYEGNNYFAVIDGNTPKGSRLWEGLPSDVFVARFLEKQMERIPGGLKKEEVISHLNQALRDCYDDEEFEKTIPEERLSAAVLIYSRSRKEVWSFGDCQCRINGVLYRHRNEIDSVLADVRSFYLETELKLGKTVKELQENDTGREMIMPLLKRQILLANQNCPFSYDMLDGGDIHLSHIKSYSVKVGDHVILASDGYPLLCETVEESEDFLADALKSDPLCMNENRGTKALDPNDNSYDDRCFLSFIVQ